jgi:hypothetical protein
MDFVRFLQGPLLGTFGFLILVLVVAHFAKKIDGVDDKGKITINRVRNGLSLVAVACLAWFAFSAAAVNEVPRNVIDRSVVDERADAVRQQGKEAREAAKRAAEQKERGEAK